MSREMKDSGIAWIGEIPKGWNVVKFYRICSIITDFVASGSFKSLRANVPYLDFPDYAMLVRTIDLSGKGRASEKVYISKHSYDFLKNSNLFGGEIILPNIGAVGDVYIVPLLYEKMSLAPNSIMFRTISYDKYWYYYFFSKAGKQAIFDICQSTAQPKFNKTDLRNIKVCVPSLLEQQQIADYLDRKCGEIDELVALQEKMIEELKAYKQSVITKAVTKGLNPNAPMKDSGIAWIGEIPEHWEVCFIKQVMRNKSIKGFPNEKVLSLYRDFGVVLKDSRDDNHNVTSEDTSSYKLVEIGDFVINKMKAWQGSMAVSDYRGIISPAYYICNFIGLNINKKYIHYLLRNETYKVEYMRLSSGLRVGQWDLNIDDFLRIKMILPSLLEQQQIADYLDKKCAEIDELVAVKQQKIETLKEYKKSLIYEYVTGKKEVI